MPTAFFVVALTGGSFILLGFMVIMFFGVVWGYYTISGSGINKHPNDGLDGAPGSEGPSEASGKGRSTGDASSEHSVGDTFSKHGTQ